VTGSVASLRGVDAGRFIANPLRPPTAVVRWGDGSRTRVNAIVGGADRLVAFVPPAKSHAYGLPGTYDVVVVFRRGSRVLGRVKETFQVADAFPRDPPFQPPVGRADPERYANQIQRYEALDRKQAPPLGGVLFVGSSSIANWTTLEEDFPGVSVINRGFGGSQVLDCTYFAPRIVLPYRPKTIVFYCGENDMGQGAEPQRVLEDFQGFVQFVHGALPDTRILFMSLKPSPALTRIADKLSEANALVQSFTQSDARLGYIDVATPMLGPDGQPRAELFKPDGQHLSPRGYALWTEVVKGSL
jgi:lysophospholipase L1-like esterase